MINPELKKIRDKVVSCKNCSLYKTRTLPVIGEGSHQADIMFVGEAPGANEDKTGKPFCGRAGDILSELLQNINLKRDDVYIANTLKCRPPGNRDPLKSEIESCTPYLMEQIKIIKPKAICCLGNFSVRYIMEKFNLEDKIQGISKIHGNTFEGNNEEIGKIKIVPLYHPAVATYNSNMMETLAKDFQILKKINIAKRK